MPTNTKESGFEALIVNWLVEHNGYEEGSNTDYNKEYAIDETRLFRFLQDTQPEQLEKLGIRKTKCTMQRLNWNSISLESRSSLYC